MLKVRGIDKSSGEEQDNHILEKEIILSKFNYSIQPQDLAQIRSPFYIYFNSNSFIQNHQIYFLGFNFRCSTRFQLIANFNHSHPIKYSVKMIYSKKNLNIPNIYFSKWLKVETSLNSIKVILFVKIKFM